MWCVSCRMEEKILEPLGLCTSGGGANRINGKQTYWIYEIDNQSILFCEVDIDRINDVYKYIPWYNIKEKILKIKERICLK
jgi:hypothetical protein